MTTSGGLSALSVRGYFQRLRANWPAGLLPVVAAGLLGLLHNPLPLLMLIATLLLAALAPKGSAKLAPFGFLAYGAYGFFLAHSLDVWEARPGTYGLVQVGPADNVPWVLPQRSPAWPLVPGCSRGRVNPPATTTAACSRSSPT